MLLPNHRTARSGHRHQRCLAALGAAVALASPATAADPPAVWPARVVANYRIAFAGLDIGRFDFTSDVTGKAYKLNASAEMSLLLGAFKWSGSTQSSGDLSARDPRPASHALDFKANSKAGSVRLGFAGGKVASMSVVPPNKEHADIVPLQAKHMADVLDPLTAVLSLSRYDAANPCGRRISIFDGKQRFDLVFSFKRQEKVADKKSSGQPDVGYVCRVRYVPIAGYRMNKETRHMTGNDGIEVALRPVPEANVLVPYRVTVPTIAGSATLTSHRIEIITQSKKQIALVN